MKKITVKRLPLTEVRCSFARVLDSGKIKHYHIRLPQFLGKDEHDVISGLGRHISNELGEPIELEVLPVIYEKHNRLIVDWVTDLSFLSDRVTKALKRRAFKNTLEQEPSSWLGRFLSKFVSTQFLKRLGFRIQTSTLVSLCLCCGEEDVVAAWKQIGEDLEILFDYGITGHLMMPSTFEMSNMAGNGKKVHMLCVYPLIDLDNYNVLKTLLNSENIAMESSFLSSFCEEGDMVYFRGKQPYMDLVVEEEDVQIRLEEKDDKHA